MHFQSSKDYDKEFNRMLGGKQKKREKFQMNFCGMDFERATSRISFWWRRIMLCNLAKADCHLYNDYESFSSDGLYCFYHQSNKIALAKKANVCFIYGCKYVRASMCMFLCLCLFFVCLPAFLSVCVCIHVCLPACLSVYLPVCVNTYICVFACLCLWVYLSICVRVRACVHAIVCVHMYMHMHSLCAHASACFFRTYL